MAKQIHKSMQGRVIDMEALRARNETMPAIGNARMNARGDEMGPGGKIIRKREESMAAYYENNPNAKGPVADTIAPNVVTAPVAITPADTIPADTTLGKKK